LQKKEKIVKVKKRGFENNPIDFIDVMLAIGVEL
jgi:hypothetical protein